MCFSHLIDLKCFPRLEIFCDTQQKAVDNVSNIWTRFTTEHQKREKVILSLPSDSIEWSQRMMNLAELKRIADVGFTYQLP